MLPDMRAQFASADRFEETSDFLLFARGQKLYPSIAQVLHGPGDIETFRYLPD